MFLKISISNTRKFLRRTIQSVMSFFNEGTYQRLPKTPPLMPLSCIGRHGLDKTLSQSYRELDKFYTDFTNLQSIDNRHDSKKMGNKNTSSTSAKGFGHARVAFSEDYDQVEECTRDYQKKKRIVSQTIGEEGEETLSNSCKSVVTREERRCLVARKLKELEGMELSNVENAMDIEEALHYYSHLTSPVYMEIFDQFFVNIYADLFKQFSRQQAAAHSETGHMKGLVLVGVNY